MSRNVAGDLEKLGPVNSRDRVSHITLHDYNRQASLRVTYERVTQQAKPVVPAYRFEKSYVYTF